jgi:EAL and modified HD-GYP domain-containing signal transduction protein
MQQLQLARQPIYDRQQRVIGYELLFRGPRPIEETNGDHATARVVVDALMEIGLDAVVGDRLAFVNASREFLVAGLALVLPAGRTVVEVLEDVDGDPEVVEAVEELVAHGHTVALDDFRFRDELRPLLPHAAIVKVEVAAFERDGLAAELAHARSGGARLLAEKVETHEQLERALALGFSYFQGYVFERPRLVEGRSGVPPEHVTRLRLLAALQQPGIDFDELERIVVTDVSLSYRLLRFINSAYFALPRKVASIREALVMLGLDAVRRWATVVTLADVADKPRELFVTGLARARMCELLAAQRAVSPAERYFLAGLLSVLDALVDAPLETVVGELPLAPEVTEALLRKSGDVGATLETVVSYEHGAFDRCSLDGVAAHDLTAAFVAAIGWAGSLGQSAE